MKFHSLLKCGLFSGCCTEDAELYPQNESENLDTGILDAQILDAETSPINISPSDSKIEDEAVEFEAEETTKEDKMEEKEEIEGEKGEKGNAEKEEKKEETEDVGHYSFKRLLSLEEISEEDDKNILECKKQVNKMAEMKQIMLDFFGNLKKGKNKEYSSQVLEEDELDDETDFPQKRELKPSVLKELKNIVQELLDTIKIERFKELQFTGEEDNETSILAEMILPEIQENELTTLQTFANSNVRESTDAEVAVLHIEDQENGKAVNNSTQVKELKQIAKEHLEVVGVKNFNGKPMKKTATESKLLVTEKHTGLETIVEEVVPVNMESEESAENGEPTEAEPKIVTSDQADQDLSDDEDELLPTRQSPFQRYFRTFRKSHKK